MSYPQYGAPPPGYPAPPPRAGMSTNQKLGCALSGCGGAAFLSILFVGCVAIVAAPNDGQDSEGETVAEQDEEDTTDDTDEDENEDEDDEDEDDDEDDEDEDDDEDDEDEDDDEDDDDEADEDSEILLEAEATEFAPSILNDGGDYTSVLITVTNESDENVSVNPLYFYIVDTDGTKHDTISGLGEDENQIDTVTLSPGQNASGTVTAEGALEAESVEFEEDLFGEAIVAEVE